MVKCRRHIVTMLSFWYSAYLVDILMLQKMQHTAVRTEKVLSLDHTDAKALVLLALQCSDHITTCNVPPYLAFVVSSTAIPVAVRPHSTILHVTQTFNSTHVTPLKCVPVSSLHSQITTRDLIHTVTLFNACFLTINHESTINIRT